MYKIKNKNKKYKNNPPEKKIRVLTRQNIFLLWLKNYDW